MVKAKSSSEMMTLERIGMALSNVKRQAKVAAIMADFGYGPEEIEFGDALLNKTRDAYDGRKRESEEAAKAYQDFDALRIKLGEQYSRLRKKAKVVFRKDALVLDKLAVSGELPSAYVNWLEGVRKFLNVVKGDESIRNEISRLKVTDEDLNMCNEDLVRLEDLRAIYLKEKGESQNATQIKDAHFAELDDWMRDFYAVAKIALEDQPQLLETLGLVIKS